MKMAGGVEDTAGGVEDTVSGVEESGRNPRIDCRCESAGTEVGTDTT